MLETLLGHDVDARKHQRSCAPHQALAHQHSPVGRSAAEGSGGTAGTGWDAPLSPAPVQNRGRGGAMFPGDTGPREGATHCGDVMPMHTRPWVPRGWGGSSALRGCHTPHVFPPAQSVLRASGASALRGCHTPHVFPPAQSVLRASGASALRGVSHSARPPAQAVLRAYR
eukprot:scaffold21208_cov112-Isochrysis_galbana.AAC.1